MTSRRRALLIVCWLVVAGLLLRIAVAGGTFNRLDDHSPMVAAAAIGAGLAILGLSVILVAGFAVGSAGASRVSLVGAVPTIAYGVSLVATGHESGSLIALAAAVGLVASTSPRHDRRPSA